MSQPSSRSTISCIHHRYIISSHYLDAYAYDATTTNTNDFLCFSRRVPIMLPVQDAMISHSMFIQPMERNIDDAFEDTHELRSASSNTPLRHIWFACSALALGFSMLRLEFWVSFVCYLWIPDRNTAGVDGFKALVDHVLMLW